MDSQAEIGWLNRCRRPAKEWECLNDNALAFLRWASARLIVTVLNDPKRRAWAEWNGFWPVTMTPTTCGCSAAPLRGFGSRTQTLFSPIRNRSVRHYGWSRGSPPRTSDQSALTSRGVRAAHQIAQRSGFRLAGPSNLPCWIARPKDGVPPILPIARCALTLIDARQIGSPILRPARGGREICRAKDLRIP